MENKVISVPAIHCQHCVRTIERELSELDGVTAVKADIDSKQVTVTWQDEQVHWDSIRELLHEIGYPLEA